MYNYKLTNLLDQLRKAKKVKGHIAFYQVLHLREELRRNIDPTSDNKYLAEVIANTNLWLQKKEKSMAV